MKVLIRQVYDLSEVKLVAQAFENAGGEFVAVAWDQHTATWNIFGKVLEEQEHNLDKEIERLDVFMPTCGTV